MLLKRANFGSV